MQPEYAATDCYWQEQYCKITKRMHHVHARSQQHCSSVVCMASFVSYMRLQLLRFEVLNRLEY